MTGITFELEEDYVFSHIRSCSHIYNELIDLYESTHELTVESSFRSELVMLTSQSELIVLPSLSELRRACLAWLEFQP